MNPARSRLAAAVLAAAALLPALAACGPADMAGAFGPGRPTSAPAVPAPVTTTPTSPAAAPTTTASTTTTTSAPTVSSAPAAPPSAAARPGSAAPAASPAGTAARPGVLQLGTTIFASWRDNSMATSLFDQARAAGATWVRLDIGWASVEENGPGQVSAWYRDRLDSLVAAADARGLKVLMMIHGTPGWARPSGSRDDAYPSDPGQFQRVMQYLASRYRGKVPAWEIWNEPDCLGGGGCPNGDPAAFVPVLKAGARGVRAGDPGATVVSGGISGNNAAWVERMYAAGAGGSFDALAVHPYLAPANTAPTAPRIGTNYYRMPVIADVRSVMNRHGDGGKPVWFTEFGWTTSQAGSNPGVDEATQARYLQEAVQLIQNSYPYVTNAFWYSMRDRDDANAWENHFGLLRVDGSPKPSMAAFRSANAWLAGR